MTANGTQKTIYVYRVMSPLEEYSTISNIYFSSIFKVASDERKRVNPYSSD